MMVNRQLRGIYLVVAVVAIITHGYADRTDQYQRKSVSYVNTVLTTEPGISLPLSWNRELIRKIQNAVEIERFDLNPLPDTVLVRFRQVVHTRGRVSRDEVADILVKTVGRDLAGILDIKKEMRAQNLVTDVQRNSFIGTKAKEIGITAGQLQEIMNSAYLYIPVITGLEFDRDDDEITCALNGGILWFGFNTDGDTTTIEKFQETITAASHSVDDGDRHDAFSGAVDIFVLNLSVAIRTIEAFRLGSTISRIQGNQIFFPLGQKEGIKTDDPFIVGEWYQSRDGNVTFKEDGFVRIGEVSDNRDDPDQLSAAWAIKRGYWVRGMTVKEHPRLPIDFAFKPKRYPLSASSGTLFNSRLITLEFPEYHGNVIGADASIQLNLAPFINRSQTFVVATGSFGVAGINFTGEETITDEDGAPVSFPVMGFVGGQLGYMKKKYIRRVAVHSLVAFGFQDIFVSTEIDDKDLSLRNRMVGLNGEIGLEYAVNVDVNVGLSVGYRWYPVGYWLLKYNDKEKEFEIPVDIFNPDKPKVYSDGLEIGFYIHYSLPAIFGFSLPGPDVFDIGSKVLENL